MPKGLKVVMAVSAETNPSIFIYDEIGPGYWGMIDAMSIIEALKEIGDVEAIDVRINSPGGSVFDAAAIFNHLREHKAKIHVKVDGLAASAASVIAMVGDSIEIAPNAMIMIHEASTIVWGNKSEMIKTADLLDKIDGTLIDTYVKRTGNTAEDVKAWVEAETWFTAKEAVEKGFADSIAGESVPEDATLIVPKGRFKHVPKNVKQIDRQYPTITLAQPPEAPKGSKSKPEAKDRAYSPAVVAARVRALQSSLS